MENFLCASKWETNAGWARARYSNILMELKRCDAQTGDCWAAACIMFLLSVFHVTSHCLKTSFGSLFQVRITRLNKEGRNLRFEHKAHCSLPAGIGSACPSTVGFRGGSFSRCEWSSRRTCLSAKWKIFLARESEKRMQDGLGLATQTFWWNWNGATQTQEICVWHLCRVSVVSVLSPFASPWNCSPIIDYDESHTIRQHGHRLRFIIRKTRRSECKVQSEHACNAHTGSHITTRCHGWRNAMCAQVISFFLVQLPRDVET